MVCVAICTDAIGAQRGALFQGHVMHQLKHMGVFLLTGPVASADGASGVGDDPRLWGSVYCLDVETLDDARAIMEADPFMQGAWARVDYYNWDNPSGAWSEEATRPKGLSPDFRCYFAAFTGETLINGALMSGPLQYLQSTATSSERFLSFALLHADSIAHAQAQAPGAAWVAALPIAIGRWVRITSPADLQGH